MASSESQPEQALRRFARPMEEILTKDLPISVQFPNIEVESSILAVRGSVNFFSLPPELRGMVYKFHFTSAQIILDISRDRATVIESEERVIHTTKNINAILAASQQSYHDARPYFFKHVDFIFDGQLPKRTEQYTFSESGQWEWRPEWDGQPQKFSNLNCIPKSWHSMIRRLTLHRVSLSGTIRTIPMFSGVRKVSITMHDVVYQHLHWRERPRYLYGLSIRSIRSAEIYSILTNAEKFINALELLRGSLSKEAEIYLVVVIETEFRIDSSQGKSRQETWKWVNEWLWDGEVMDEDSIGPGEMIEINHS